MSIPVTKLLIAGNDKASKNLIFYVSQKAFCEEQTDERAQEKALDLRELKRERSERPCLVADCMQEGLVEDLIRYCVGHSGTKRVDANILANYFLAESLASSLRQLRSIVQKNVLRKVGMGPLYHRGIINKVM